MYRLIASDMDETFLGAGHRLPEANVHALERLHELGVLFVPSSGRPYGSIVESFNGVDPRLLENTYVISYNGGFINRFGDEKPLISTTLDRKIAERIYDIALERHQCVHAYTPSGRILIQFAPEFEREHIRGISGVEYVDDGWRDLGFVGDEAIVKMILMDPDFDAVKRLGDEVMAEFAGEPLEVTYSSNRYAECMPAGVNKGTGLAHLAELLGIDMAETIGVGDSANDLDMIQIAGLGVGVANSTDDIRPFCDLILDTDCEAGAFEELVSRVIEPEHR